jgi:hypothetical protein
VLARFLYFLLVRKIYLRKRVKAVETRVGAPTAS